MIRLNATLTEPCPTAPQVDVEVFDLIVSLPREAAKRTTIIVSYDLLIRNGVVVDPTVAPSPQKNDIAIEKGKISALARPGQLPGSPARTAGLCRDLPPLSPFHRRGLRRRARISIQPRPSHSQPTGSGCLMGSHGDGTFSCIGTDDVATTLALKRQVETRLALLTVREE